MEDQAQKGEKNTSNIAGMFTDFGGPGIDIPTTSKDLDTKSMLVARWAVFGSFEPVIDVLLRPRDPRKS